MSVTVLPTDLVVQGNLVANSMTIPASAVVDATVGAAANIAGSKIQQTIRKTFAQASNATVSAITEPIYLVIGANTTIQAVSAGMVVVALTPDTCTVDIKKNGTSILASAISLTSSQTARQAVVGSIVTPAGVVGDLYEVVITPGHTSGTLGQGVFVEFKAYETAT